MRYDICNSTNIEKIMMLPLKRKILIGKDLYTFNLLQHSNKDTYILELGEILPANTSRSTLILKGTISVEYLYYKGSIYLTRIPNTGKNIYEMHISNIQKVNNRRHTRVPYKRDIQIIEPLGVKGYLINISQSGALLYLDNKVQNEYVCFTLSLGKTKLKLNARIIAQTPLQNTELYETHCEFIDISNLNAKRIKNLILQIKQNAKERINVR